MAKLMKNSRTNYAVFMLVMVLGNFGFDVEAKAFFVFGDSLVDNGNNNFLATTARADAPPYGIDYPTHRPTGRFSNGLNIPDIISKLTFIIFSPVYLFLDFSTKAAII